MKRSLYIFQQETPGNLPLGSTCVSLGRNAKNLRLLPAKLIVPMFCLALSLWLFNFTVQGESGETVVVVYNSLLPASREIAEYYAKQRQVPENQMLGLELPASETISRSDFRSLLQKPLSRWMEKQKLFITRLSPASATNTATGNMFWKVVEAKIRYAVLCHGVPLRILEDSSVKETPPEKLPVPIRKNVAAVDSELALLPMLDAKLPLLGFIPNPFYAATNAAVMHPTNGILLVARLDGPTPAIAKSLVDKAIAAEVNGAWGRAYFDLRGLTDGEYKLGDDWMRKASEMTRHMGIETVVDEKAETYPAAFPMSQIGFYFGWYDANVSGPFTRPKVEFMPGAIAYHLHSYSASTVRSATQNWVGPLLAKGATATMGCVDEPFLALTPEIATFTSRLLFLGFSFGEAAYAAQPGLSWQTTVVGDPLYHPFSVPPQERYEALAAQKNPLIEWSHLLVANRNLVQGYPVDEVVKYLEETGTNSAVLTEKLGDLHSQQGKPWAAINAYAQVLNLKPSPQQETRILLNVGEKLTVAKRAEEALAMYKLLVKKAPDYPDLLGVYQKMLLLANTLGKKDETETYQKEVHRLAPAIKK